MKIKTSIKKMALRVWWTVMAALPLFAFVSCDGLVYDYEGDCSVTYRLKFRYDKNLKWADAFANEVTSVHVYAFDPSGVLVWQQEEQMNPATAEDYSMQLDLPAGNYKLLGAASVMTVSAKSPFPCPKPGSAKPVWRNCSVRSTAGMMRAGHTAKPVCTAFTMVCGRCRCP